MKQVGAEEARKQFAEILSRASQGSTTIITRRGRPCAAVVPLDALPAPTPIPSIVDLRGSGTNLWGANSLESLGALRDEWGP